MVNQRKTKQLELKPTGTEAAGQPNFPFVHKFWESHRTWQSLEYNQVRPAHKKYDNIDFLTRFHTLGSFKQSFGFSKIK